ncbi:DUF7144 family membrane protein [Streptomyces massasporeus]|uniref:DUF7144 family membrane protein n=1 Tax=Streptomyces massasporeus TaxID=67324 RepID=UPI0036AD8827
MRTVRPAVLGHRVLDPPCPCEEPGLVFTYDAWGWIWITVGIAQLLAGVGVLVGSRAARLTGIVPASFCLVGQLMFLSAFPWWSVATLSVLVIFGPVAEPRHVPGTRV